jgi:ArsR family transcriptional regulator
MPPEARRVWSFLESEVDDAVLQADQVRAQALLRARQRAWPDAIAGQMERHYSPGRTWEALARAFVGLMRLGDVLDAGSGDGTIAQLIASRARSVTCLDVSAKMLAAARTRLAGFANVRFARGDVHAIPAAPASFDQVLLFNVLTFAEHPARALAEAARVLRRGGELVLVTLDAHRHAETAAAYGHVQPGFKPAALRRILAAAGLQVERCEVTSRERREPHFNVVTAFARKPK